MKKAIALVYGKTDMRSRDRKNFAEGDALWDCQYIDIDTIELKRWSMDEEEEARKELAKYKSRYWECSGIFYAEEYGLEYREYDDEWELQERGDIYAVAEDEKVEKAEEIAKLIRESGGRDPELLEEFCCLADMGADWELACLLEEDIKDGLADEGDGESCEEVINRAENELGVWLY